MKTPKSPARYLVLPALIVAAIITLASPAVDPVFRKLWVLEGLWRMETSKGIIFEQWVKMDDNTLKGLSYRISNADTVILESILLVSEPDGISYVPTVASQNDAKPVRFSLTEHADNRFLFENPEHDFPQRVIYTLITTDSLVARIEGLSNGKPAGSNFYFRRVR